jgi:hypothetical protein
MRRTWRVIWLLCFSLVATSHALAQTPQNTPITTGAFGRANTTLAGQTLFELEESATTVGPFALVDASRGRSSRV